MFPANRERTFCFPWVNHGPFALHPHLCKSTGTPIVNFLTSEGSYQMLVVEAIFRNIRYLGSCWLAGFLPFFPSFLRDSGSTAIRPLTKLRPMWTSNERTTPKTIDEAKTGAISRSYGDVQTYRLSEDVLKDFCLAGRKQRHSETSSTKLEYNP